ncbi:hypothetical protein [Paenibacillus sp. BK033]|nr:hypothetical protein [Paenibacillus sp. BK033]
MGNARIISPLAPPMGLAPMGKACAMQPPNLLAPRKAQAPN